MLQIFANLTVDDEFQRHRDVHIGTWEICQIPEFYIIANENLSINSCQQKHLR